MSLKDTIIKTIFTVSDDKDTVTPSASEKPFPRQTYSTPSVQTEYNTVNQSISTGGSQKYRDHFLKLMKEANLPGNDYYELNMSLEALVSAIPDERTRFTAAYVPLSLNGLTKERVNSTAKSYLAALDQDASNFNSSLEQVRAKEVSGQKQQIENNNKQIQELTLQIQKLTNDNVAINQSVSESEQKISASKSGYEAELNNWKNTIINNLNKINQYITQ